MKLNRSFLVIPRLIIQPTWGGNYILKKKKLNSFKNKNFCIGQSYELFHKTKLAYCSKLPEIKQGFPEIADSNGNIIKATTLEYIDLFEEAKKNSLLLFGPSVCNRYSKFPLLIKFTQAHSNSFQIHLKSNISHPKWKAKPEIWYYLKPGIITLGIMPNIDIEEYENTCLMVYKYMLSLSNKIIQKKISLYDAQKKAFNFIKKNDPHEFVQTHEIKENTIIDLTSGGIHHSWENCPEKYSYGNVVYEIQKDVCDDISTIRSFDQGKFNPDGSIRSLHIEDYFKFLDTNFENNLFENHVKKLDSKLVFEASFFSLQKIFVNGKKKINLDSSFNHIFVLNGSINCETEENMITVDEGYSAFIPYACSKYYLNSKKSIVLITSTNN